ncbi:MAG: transcription elongation factor GreAB [Geobacteraceae bacterium GWC2_48_7]|nr:MAG: transcription elongation factor GreAB [Geobacteraceae bacterium GWC2_48_7]
MTKSELVMKIITKLTDDLKVLFTAATAAHEASIHEENIPDNKYDTLALEASYVAQGQANRAQEIRQSIEIYKNLRLLQSNDQIIRLTSLVTVETDNGMQKIVFIGPAEGGLKIIENTLEIMVITPASPLGRELLGKSIGDNLEILAGTYRSNYEIIKIS